MRFFQALLYFTREAALNLFRGWKVSLLAVLTIAVSLFLGGVFLLVSSNLGRVIEQWRGESKIVVYLDREADETDRKRVEGTLRQLEETLEVEVYTPEEAAERFRQTFPSLSDLLEGWGDNPLPASIEVRLDWSRLEPVRFESWLETVRGDPAVAMVDDDRDWIGQLEAVVLVLRGLGVLIGSVLLLTAVFTISSVIRLTAYLYRDEIAVMRLVGATEFFIRGPFYVEGLLQGLLGGGLALAILTGTYSALASQHSDSLVASVLAADFLSSGQLLALVGLGTVAGLVGAVTSLRREDLEIATEPADDWSPE